MGLVGCVTPIVKPLHQPTTFSLEGRLAIRTQANRYHVQLVWQHAQVRDEILITTPLGQGIAELTRDASGARLTMADRQQRIASDWEALSAQVFNVSLPLTGLPRWIFGHPPPATSGWKCQILSVEEGLPKQIHLERDDIELQLIVDKWLEMK